MTPRHDMMKMVITNTSDSIDSEWIRADLGREGDRMTPVRVNFAPRNRLLSTYVRILRLGKRFTVLRGRSTRKHLKT